METVKSLCALLVMSSVCFSQGKDEAALRKRVSDFQEAWNHHDAPAITAFWAEDGDLINPAGVRAMGRGEIEKVIAGDLENFIRDGSTLFTVSRIRWVKPGVAILDMTHDITGTHAPDGSLMPSMKVLVTGVAVKNRGQWWWLAARAMVPYAPPGPISVPVNPMPVPSPSPAPGAGMGG